jgi:alpha-tubulin suppressor-like RCC1 family protein
MNLKHRFRKSLHWSEIALFASTLALTSACSSLVDPNPVYNIPRAVPTPITGALGQHFTMVSSGFFHTCALDADGRAWCWGDNLYRQTGRTASGSPCDQVSTCTLSPQLVETTLRFITLSAGVTHTCAIAVDATAWCWGGGYPATKMLGDSVITQSAVPVAVAGGLKFKSISTGGRLTCGITLGDRAWCWGVGGTAGNGSSTNAPTPVAVAGGHSFTQISAGTGHACALTSEGTAWCWGGNTNGELGDGVFGDLLKPGGGVSTVPVRVAGNLLFKSISAGSSDTCGTTLEGSSFCWGQNHVGQLGTGSPGESRATPQQVTGGYVFAGLSAGAVTSCALVSGGKPMCWGGNWFGGLGDGTSTAENTGSERGVPGLTKAQGAFVQISVGGSHVCALADTGILKCWGDRARGQMGDGRA